MTTYVRDDVQVIDGKEVIISLYSCNGCGRVWDGNAQCFPCDGEEDEKEVDLLTKEVDKRKAALTANVIEVVRPLKRHRVLNTELAEERINEILDGFPPEVAEKLSSKIAIARVL
jgi:hypothetical protein